MVFYSYYCSSEFCSLFLLEIVILYSFSHFRTLLSIIRLIRDFAFFFGDEFFPNDDYMEVGSRVEEGKLFGVEGYKPEVEVDIVTGFLYGFAKINFFRFEFLFSIFDFITKW